MMNNNPNQAKCFRSSQVLPFILFTTLFGCVSQGKKTLQDSGANQEQIANAAKGNITDMANPSFLEGPVRPNCRNGETALTRPPVEEQKPIAKSTCPKLLKEAVKTGQKKLVITFDGLGTNQLGSKLLKRKVFDKIAKRCGKENVTNLDSAYSKRGAAKALKCAQSFVDTFGESASINIIGHSYGGGKGVMNFIEGAQKSGLTIDNAMTFDPRGYSYKYTNPAGHKPVRNFINFYQSGAMKGMKVKNADHEVRVPTLKSNHVGLPADYGDDALKFMSGKMECAR